MAGMGLKIVSFNIKDLKDENQYIRSLGVRQTVAVVRDAAIAEAEARRETDVSVAAANQAGEQARIKAAEQVAEANRNLQVKQAQFKREADTAAAEAEMAHALKTTEIEEDLTRRKGAVAVEAQRQAALAAQENLRVAELHQQSQTIIPAEAARRATVEQATGAADATKLTAEAEAVRVKATQLAEAEGLKARGLAQAESERAQLLARAEGEQQLAEALSAQQGVNFLLEALRLKMDVDARSNIARAQALGQLGAKLTVTQIGNGGSNGHGTLVDTVLGQLVSANAQVEGLTGESLKEQIAGFLSLLKEQDQFASVPAVSPHEESAVAAGSPDLSPTWDGVVEEVTRTTET
jgi:flotillin